MNSAITPHQLEVLLPLACDWAVAQEQRILATGEPLTDEQALDARRIGVAHPERVRTLHVSGVPVPEHALLRAAAQATGLISPLTGGMALRYGIFIREDCRGDRALLLHELAHTMQYERLGGFESFLRQYLTECVSVGYPAAPLEQEAIAVAARISGSAAGR
jgi:hypothetical protein